MSHLLQLARPQTLPLAFAVICCGNALAYQQGDWRFSVFIFSVLTALSLQILSNMANDYGDGIRGTDHYRTKDAPLRLIAAGIVQPTQVRKYLIACIIVSISFGIALLAVSFQTPTEALLFLILGALAILAAISYTVGRYAYAYYALGEVSVFCFFGLLGVIGSYYLQSGICRPGVLLPATGCGLLSAAVLHINNMRDIDSDRLAGKYTVAVKLGFDKSKKLQRLFLTTACICYAGYAFVVPTTLLFLLLLPAMIRHSKHLYASTTPNRAGKELKNIVMINLGVNVLFSVGLILGRTIT